LLRSPHKSNAEAEMIARPIGRRLGLPRFGRYTVRMPSAGRNKQSLKMNWIGRRADHRRTGRVHAKRREIIDGAPACN
jgi:hypothetical protein